MRRDVFSAVCPNAVPKASKVDVHYRAKASGVVVITSAKWCPLDSCTVLVLGCQSGVKLFDWDGSTQIFEYDFHENGIGVDDRYVAGGMARGIAAIGANYIAVGIHTVRQSSPSNLKLTSCRLPRNQPLPPQGTILLFEVTTDSDSFVCRIVDSQRQHAKPLADLASTTTSSETQRDVMLSQYSDKRPRKSLARKKVRVRRRVSVRSVRTPEIAESHTSRFTRLLINCVDGKSKGYVDRWNALLIVREVRIDWIRLVAYFFRHRKYDICCFPATLRCASAQR